MKRVLRKAIWRERDLDQQSRDLRDIFATIPEVEIVEREGLYSTGLTISYEQGSLPVAIELVRCVLANDPESVVSHGTACSFRLRQSGAEITRIDGLTPDTGTRYRLTFRITYGVD